MLGNNNKMSANRLQSMVGGLEPETTRMKASLIFGVEIN